VTQFSTNRAREGAYLVYINGVQVPGAQVQVHFEVNQIPNASVSLAPDPVLNGLGAEDRVELQVFYKDDDYYGEPKMCLLYDGAIAGQSYSNGPFSRSLSFNSFDHLQVLDTLNPYFASGVPGAVMPAFGSPSGTDATLPASELTMPWNIMFAGLDQKTVIRRPYDFVENILKISCGRKEIEKLGSVVTAQFYARHLTKLAFPRRFIPSPLLETELLKSDDVYGDGAFPMIRVMRTNGVFKAIARSVAKIGLGSTMWRTIQGLFASMYYELLAIPAPPIVQVDRTRGTELNGTILGPPRWVSNEEAEAKNSARILFKDLVAAYDDASPDRPNYLLNYVTKPQWIFGVAPACNVVFPSMISEINVQLNYWSSPTRLYVNDNIKSSVNAGDSAASQTLGHLAYGYPEQVQYELDKRYKKASADFNPTVSGKNLLVWPEEFFRGPSSAELQSPNWLVYVEQHLQSMMTRDEQLARDALHTLDAYLDNMEVNARTNALIEVDLETEGQSVSDEDRAKMVVEREKKIQRELLKGNRVKMDMFLEHLRSTGLIDKSVTNVDAAREALNKRAYDQELQRDRIKRVLARYEFQRMRGQARAATVTMAFNPYLVPGYPVMVFDELSSGQHLVGYLKNVTHNLSSDGMSTTISLLYVQNLEEFVHEVFDARMGNSPDGVLENVQAAPPIAISEVRDVVQYLDRSEEYFSLLLHQGASYKGRTKRTAFDFTSAIRFEVNDKHYTFDDLFSEQARLEQKRRADQEVKDLEEVQKLVDERVAELKKKYVVATEPYASVVGLDKGTLEVTAEKFAEKVVQIMAIEEERAYQKKLERELKKPREHLASPILSSYTAIVPSAEFKPMFENFDRAMSFVSRPVCTLDEYIRFRGRWGTRVGAIKDMGVTYYTKILGLRAGPGDTPEFNANNVVTTPKLEDIPDTRVDWTARLMRYRGKFAK